MWPCLVRFTNKYKVYKQIQSHVEQHYVTHKCMSDVSNRIEINRRHSDVHSKTNSYSPVVIKRSYETGDSVHTLIRAQIAYYLRHRYHIYTVDNVTNNNGETIRICIPGIWWDILCLYIACKALLSETLTRSSTQLDPSTFNCRCPRLVVTQVVFA